MFSHLLDVFFFKGDLLFHHNYGKLHSMQPTQTTLNLPAIYVTLRRSQSHFVISF